MIWIDVDTAVTVPVNILPLADDTDYKTEENPAYNAAGMDLIWNFQTTAGVQTQTAVTPTTGGNYDWTCTNGMAKCEIPASGGASANNDTEGFGWWSGRCTGVLPWRGPVVGFRAAALNDLLIDNAFSTTRGLAGTALPDAAADAAGGVVISDAGGLDIDSKLANTNEVTAARMGALTDWINGGRLDLLLDGIKAVTDLLPDAGALNDLATLTSRLTSARAGYLDELGAANLPADIDTLLTRVTAAVATAAAMTTAQNDLDILTGTDGATLATAQGNYAPAKAGDEMDLVNAPNATAITAIQNGLATLTKLLKYVQLLARSDAAIETDNATELTAINADGGSGAGNYSAQTEALEAIRDRGDAAWVTGGGGSISDIINIQPLIPSDIDLANTATYRIGLMLINSLDDLPSTAEITPGTISIDRKAIGATTWTSIVSDAACSEIAGLIYYDEVFDSGTGYAEGDSIRITLKSQKVTVAANDYEIIGTTGRMFYTKIRQTMRGTDGANTTTPPTAAAIVNEWETQSQADPTGFQVNVKEINDTAQTANDNGADINTLLTRIVGTLAAGTHVAQSADNDTKLSTLLTHIVGTLAAGTHNAQTGDSYAVVNSGVFGNSALKTLIDTIDSVVDSIKAVTDLLPNAGALSDLATLASRLTAARAGYLDELGAANIPADIDTLLTRITAAVATATALATAQSDLDILTGSDGATLATLQGNYAPAKVGDNMNLSDDAITSAKFDESTAFPIKSADSGSTELARTGADNDTLETLSDQMDVLNTSIASVNPPKNTALSNIPVQMILTSDHITPATGKTVTGQRSIDGGAYGSVSGSIAEIGSGTYQFDALAADMNGDIITFKFSNADCDDTFITIRTSG